MEFFNKEPKVTESEAYRRENAAREKGLREGWLSVIGAMYKEAHGISAIEQLFDTLEQKRLDNTLSGSLEIKMLESLIESTHTNFIGWNAKTGFDTIKFDSNKHLTWDQMRDGERAQVTIVGCVLGNPNLSSSETIVKPTVVRI